MGEKHVCVLGSVCEPINPKAWEWYNEHIGKAQCSSSTRSGRRRRQRRHALPGAIETKSGSATVPFFGNKTVILDPQSGKELVGNNVEGVLAIRTSIARTVYQDHAQYLETYIEPYPGVFFTGDGTVRDKDG